MSAGPSFPDIASRWKLHRAGREWRGSCPVCGYGSDAFVLTVRDGRVLGWCASCQDRDAIGRLLRGDGVVSPDPARLAAAERDRAAKAERARERALALWNGADPAGGTPVETYLAERHLGELATSPALRWRRDCPHPVGGRLPAMLALVTGPDGQPSGVHRTFLKPDGTGKAQVAPTKASLGGIWRGAIRLADAGPALVVGEGIETAAAAGRLARLPAWAAISAGNMARAMVLPPEVREVVIAVDNDAPGRQAAREAGARWRAEGRRVRFLRPRTEGADMADVLAERVGALSGVGAPVRAP